MYRFAIAAIALVTAACGDDGGGGDNADASTVSDAAASVDSAPAADAAPATDGAGAGDAGGDAAVDGGPLPDGSTVACDRQGFVAVDTSTTGDADSRIHAGYSAADDPSDILTVESYPSAGAPTMPYMYELDGENYQTCPTCVIGGIGCTNGDCDKSFLGQSGTVNITSIGGAGEQMTGTVTDLVMIEVTINGTTFESTPVVDGEVWCVTSYSFDDLIEAP